MSYKMGLRGKLLASAAGVGLIAAAGNAVALEYSVGELKIVFDTTITAGASLRTAERDMQFVPESNGGPVDPRTSGVVVPVVQAANTLAGLPGYVFTQTANRDNFDGSINTDDGRLNYDQGDFTSTNLKVSHDLLMTWKNFTVFARGFYFYDDTLSDEDHTNRTPLRDKTSAVLGSHAKLLDLYIAGDFELGDIPVQVRVGKQVVSWGEGTFILHGINAINPIDVTAFRRPGAEIKEGLIPVNMISGSVSFPFDVSVEAWYQLDWEPFEIDPAGTAFSGVDTARYPSFPGFTSGSPFSGNRRNCIGGPESFFGLSGGVILGGAVPLPDIGPHVTGQLLPTPACFDGAATDYDTPLPVGAAEAAKLAQGTTDAVARARDVHAPDDGQWGVAVRYFADWLNATEFGFYAMNYHSRLPFGQLGAGTPWLGFGAVTGNNANVDPVTGSFNSLASRFAPSVGCVGPFSPNPNTFADPRFAALAATPIADPLNLINTSAANSADLILGGAGAVLAGTTRNMGDTYGAAIRINCALALAQSVLVDTNGDTVPDTPMSTNGSEYLGVNTSWQFRLVYPEDIKLYGMSFNTTVGSWGLQGEFSFRPDAPFAVDTDQQTISAAMVSCAFPVGVADLAAFAFEPLGNVDGTTACLAGAGLPTDASPRWMTAVIENDMWTGQIGTTATFTGSNPVIDFLGADLGILVTEAGFVLVPGVEDTWLDNGASATLPQYANTGCQASDLGLGGLLGLDRKSSEDCRPTDFSAGYVLLARLDYNNAFESGWVISPQITFSHDVVGVTPAPYGNYNEGRMAISGSISGQLDNAWRLSLGYTNFFGGDITNKAIDQDFASFTASYSF